MLKAELQPHREFLLANTPGQKLFVALRLQATPEALGQRAPLAVAMVVDTSGSMRERTGGKKHGQRKIELVIDALKQLLASPLLQAQDRLALIKFDASAKVLHPFASAQNRQSLAEAADELARYKGDTFMGAGMSEALKLLAQEQGNRRLLLLTDGETSDEKTVHKISQRLAQERIPVTAIGVGDEWNDELLTEITDLTQGKPFHVVADSAEPQPPSLSASELPQALLSELEHATQEVIANVALSVRCIKDVGLERITRVYPVQSEVGLQHPHPLGNVEAGEGAVFVLEFDLPQRPAARIRLAQLGLTYEVPGKGYRGELPPLDLVVEFTADETQAARIQPQIMQWVQQRNIEALVKQATAEARNNPEKAAKTLALAHTLSQRVGQTAMTQALERAALELKEKQALSPHMQKTLRVGAKTQTLSANPPSLPSDEEIRRATGG